jgi:hypothetical protein
LSFFNGLVNIKYWLIWRATKGELNMDFIESSLCRLQQSVSGFVGPAAELSDVCAIKVQIELRQRALRDIEVIRWRLRPFMRADGKRLHRRLQGRRGGRSSAGGTFTAARASRPF